MRWGIWNSNTRRFCFGIQARDKAAAYAAFNRTAPKQVRHHRCYEVRPIPRDWVNPPNVEYARQRRKEVDHAGTHH